jgi:predicted nucleic acid-binding protein
MRAHLDTDFLIYAVGRAGPERRRLFALVEADAVIEMSAIAWYEYTRGPRTPEQLAVARSFLGDDSSHEIGIVPFDELLALGAADVFRRLGSPRRRGADIAIGVTALVSRARLMTRNAQDFDGIEGLDLEVVAG